MLFVNLLCELQRFLVRLAKQLSEQTLSFSLWSWDLLLRIT